MFGLPFLGRTFTSMKNSVGFAQSGVLLTAGSSQVRGAGSGAAAAFKGAAEQTGAIVTGVRTSETAKIKARTDEVKANNELQAALAAQNAAAPDPDKQAAIAAFQTDATLATAERTRIEAEAALALARGQQSQ